MSDVKMVGDVEVTITLKGGQAVTMGGDFVDRRVAQSLAIDSMTLEALTPGVGLFGGPELAVIFRGRGVCCVVGGS